MKPREGALKQGWFLSRVTFPEAKKLKGGFYRELPSRKLRSFREGTHGKVDGKLGGFYRVLGILLIQPRR